MSEGEVQRQLEREDYLRVKRAVAAAKNSGELSRYNSLKTREKTEEDRLEQQILDLNTSKSVVDPSSKDSKTKITALATGVPVFSDKSSKLVTTTTNNVKITQKRIMTTSMIDKKNIIMENMSIKQVIN